MTTPPRSPLTLERRPSTKQAAKGAWVDVVRRMTQSGKLDTVPRPLPENATRLRRRLYERRQEERA